MQVGSLVAPLLAGNAGGRDVGPALVKLAVATVASAEERDAGAGAGVLVQAGQPVAFGKSEQHQPWLVNPLLGVFLH